MRIGTARARGRGSEPLLLLFVDGLGLAPPSSDNPLSEGHMPWLEERIGCRLVSGTAPLDRPGVCLRALDATLGVEGLPQSATGQTALFTGENAAGHVGRHVPAFPGGRLRELIARHNLLTASVRRGDRVAFANAFSPLYEERLARRRARRSVTVCCAEDAGLRRRGLADLARGDAVSWDVERDLFLAVLEAADTTDADEDGGSAPPSQRPIGLGPVYAEQAGRHLADLLGDHELVLYETFLTDLVGHGRTELSPRQALARIDSLLSGVAPAIDAQGATVVLVSDHGNIEETDHRRHTRNPVPLLALGPAAARFAACVSLCDVTPAVLACRS
ncbi:MAG: metalloenzyme [Acidobacteria bacterium]|nr:MAG: metalloenzyme [Acidobacteriota bacterium]REK11659.1 MAG: metalloenzyme [Acidobacteriota bacterium]